MISWGCWGCLACSDSTQLAGVCGSAQQASCKCAGVLLLHSHRRGGRHCCCRPALVRHEEVCGCCRTGGMQLHGVLQLL